MFIDRRFMVQRSLKVSTSSSCARALTYNAILLLVYVGYELMDCPMINWSSMTMKLKGFDVENSDLGLLHINT